MNKPKLQLGFSVISSFTEQKQEQEQEQEQKQEQEQEQEQEQVAPPPLGTEKTGWKTAEAEVVIRRRRVDWLENLNQDWDLKERTRWREDVPGVPGAKPRSGVKCSWSKSKAKSGKLKRMRLRSLRDGVKSVVKPKSGNELAGPAPSQPALSLPGVGNDLGAEDTGHWEDVVLLDEDDCLMEVDEGVKDDAQEPGKAVSSKKLVKKMSAASRLSRFNGHRVRTHDEMVE